MSVHREQIIQAALQGVAIGCPVRTSDGAELGLVKEISGDFIKVDAPLRADYWISADYVISADTDAVMLSFAKSDLGAYKRDKPDVLADEDPLKSEASVDALISEDEQMEQRVRMERELAEQRRDLPHAHPDGEDAPPDTGGTIGEPVEAELERLDPDGELSHIDDADDTPPEFMTSTDARSIVGLETDSPLVAPVESAMPATAGEPPTIIHEAVSARDAATAQHEATSIMGEQRKSAELARIEADSAGYEPAAATPASPTTAPPIETWSDSHPEYRDDAPSSIWRALMMGAGLAILLGVGFMGVRRIRHRRRFHS